MAIHLKSPQDIEAWKEAGRLSAMVLREVGKRCVPGVSTLELDEFAEAFIRLHGGIPAFKGLYGSPEPSAPPSTSRSSTASPPRT